MRRVLLLGLLPLLACSSDDTTTPVDAGKDVTVDVTVDAPKDAPADVAKDVASDATTDASVDGTTDASDASTDATSESEPSGERTAASSPMPTRGAGPGIDAKSCRKSSMRAASLTVLRRGVAPPDAQRASQATFDL